MTAPKEPHIVVSVLNWNTPDLTIAAVRSLLRQSYGSYELLVVDNGSTDESVARIRLALPEVRIIQSVTNLGFAAGHELSVRHALAANADAIWLVNSDAIAAPDALSALVAAWQASGEHLYGGATITGEPGCEQLTFPEKYCDPLGRPNAFYRDRPARMQHLNGSAQIRKVGAVIGANMLIPCSVVRRHGWMDASWFMHCEEIDYCYRLRSAGVHSFLVAASQLHHEGAGSQRGRRHVTRVIAYYRARNEIVLTARHGSAIAKHLVVLKKLARAAVSLIPSPSTAASILIGAIDGWRGRSGKTLDPDRALVRDRIAALHTDGVVARGHQMIVLGARQLHRRLAGRNRSQADRWIEQSIAGSRVAFLAELPVYVREYYRYCVEQFSRNLHRLDRELHLRFELNATADPTPVSGAVRVGFQYEHTLVRQGGRDSENAMPGAVAVEGTDERYLVRLERAEALAELDAVIEYSLPNLENLRRSGRFDEHLSRTVYLAPLLYECNLVRGMRSLPVLTTFADTKQPRRRQFLLEATRRGLPLRNVRGVYESNELRALLDTTRILVNLHQTDHHHTLEELRVLPALLRGVIVVSEAVPLTELVPYSRFIVWAPADRLLDTVASVLERYDAVHEEIFGGAAFADRVAEMRARNEQSVTEALSRLTANANATPVGQRPASGQPDRV